jgi:hypothetical protein
VEQKRERQRPLARKEGLFIQELQGEVLVYDLERDKAHCLNSTAALIWQNCDGQTTILEMRDVLEESLGVSVKEDVIWCALNQLQKDFLLEKPIVWPTGIPPISRRALVLRLGIAAVLLPMVTTITTPTAYAAVSCVGPCIGGTCPAGCTCCPDNRCKAIC